MKEYITREQAWELLKKYNKEPFHIQHGLTVDVKPEHEMEKVLYAVDELTGLIGAAALMRPSKSVQDMEVKSVKKKYKSTNFAAGCSREVIERGAQMMGCTLEELIQNTIYAMRSCEAEIAEIMAEYE